VRAIPFHEWPVFLAERTAELRLSLGAFAGRHQPVKLDVQRRHHFESHLVRLLLQGHVDVDLPEQQHRLEAGDLLWIAPGIDWVERFDPEDVPPVYLRFRLEVTRAGEPVSLKNDHRIFRSAGHTRLLMEKLVGELSAPGKPSPPMLLGLLLCLVMELTRHESADEPLPDGERRLLSQREIQALQAFFNERFHEGLTPGDLAQHVGLSPDYFSRLFHKSFQVSPRQWLLRERLRLAMDALADTDLPIKEIADSYGFCDVYYFSRQFKSYTGLPPSQFRRNTRQVSSLPTAASDPPP
jgi:AraC-like DNA-binding protein